MEKRIRANNKGLSAFLKDEYGYWAKVRKDRRLWGWQTSIIEIPAKTFTTKGARCILALLQAAHEIAAAWDHDPEAALADLQEAEGA